MYSKFQQFILRPKLANRIWRTDANFLLATALEMCYNILKKASTANWRLRMKVDTERSEIKSDVPYGVVLFFIIGFVYSCYQTLIGADKPSHIIVPDWWILTLISGFAIPLTCETMMIDKRGIKIYHLGINTRTISWASVSQAVLVPYSGTTPKQKALLFILDNGPSYQESDSAYSYKKNM